jgi:plasmid stabilization system protein ParE
VPALPVVFTRRATRQVERAAAWLCGTPVPSARHAGLRRVHLPRVKYYISYRLAPRLRQVQVVAFWHARRGVPPPI